MMLAELKLSLAKFEDVVDIEKFWKSQYEISLGTKERVPKIKTTKLWTYVQSGSTLPT